MGQWKNIYSCLRSNNISVFSPGQHEGECIEPYVVVRTGPVSGLHDFTSSTAYYELLCYIPKDQYSTLEDYVQTVKNAMKQLYPAVQYDNFELESYYDESVKGHMVSIQYRNNRKL